MKKKDGIVKWVLLVDEADDDDSTWQIVTPFLVNLVTEVSN